ncbi:MAG: metallophosphoesterase [Bacteroidia bacterium]|nr:metallophosphoesterase [Bacteroidia bacterium]MDW8236025.1 metallophosphoesterase [Bacteroidia bacterium]
MDRYLRWVFWLALWIAAEVGGYYGLKRLRLWKRWMGWITAGLFLGLLALIGIGWVTAYWLDDPREAHLLLQRISGVLFLIWLASVLTKLIGGLWGVAWPRPKIEKFSPERRATLQVIGGVLMSAPIAALGYAFWIGRYRFRTQAVEVSIPDLPPTWDGVKILQISDLHSGSFPRPEVLHPVWEKITQLSPDLIVLTGDWVNTYAAELEPFVADLRQLSAPLGKWGTLGNHDYGDYILGATPELKQKERAYLKTLIAHTGFRLLEDDAVVLEQGGEKIALIGVGNWSRWRLTHRYGDLAKAWQGVPPSTCSILLSHDPTHWESQVQGRYPIALTLSGHTHGLQFGVEWQSWQFSPAQWLYTYWAGLYEVQGQKLYVNRGLGYIGVPARLGIWPEITLLTLRST